MKGGVIISSIFQSASCIFPPCKQQSYVDAKNSCWFSSWGNNTQRKTSARSGFFFAEENHFLRSIRICLMFNVIKKILNLKPI